MAYKERKLIPPLTVGPDINRSGIAIIPNDKSKPVIYVSSEVQAVAESVAISHGLGNRDYVLSSAIVVIPTIGCGHGERIADPDAIQRNTITWCPTCKDWFKPR